MTAMMDLLPRFKNCHAEFAENRLNSESFAVFSDDRRYRYLLGRRWSKHGSLVLWILTNPSKAGAFIDDSTVKVATRFSKCNSYGGMLFVNLKAFISTDPKMLVEAWKQGVDVTGPRNEEVLSWALDHCRDIILAWGAGGSFLRKDRHMVKNLVRRGFSPLCLGTTKEGHPRHPLRLSYDTELIPFVT